jgi:N-acetylglucosamine kinase-like BadF-type ATPase
MSVFLGIDVGGSKTHALLTDEQGTILGLGETGPGNHESVGYDGLIHAMQTAFQFAASQYSITPDQILGAGFGIAGYDWPSERQDTLDAITHLGLTCPIEVVNDAVLGLYAGSKNSWGINLIAGTSNNCYGRDPSGNKGRVTGAGMLFGEFGGAVEIVVKAVQSVNYQWIKRGPETQLSQRLMEITGTNSLAQLMENLAMQIIPINPLWAVDVIEIAAQGDPVAQGVIQWAGLELAELAKAVIRQLEFEKSTFDLVLSGSLLQKGNILVTPVQSAVAKFAPGANFITLDVPPVTGAVLLGMRAAGLDTMDIFSTFRKNIIRSINAL